jgi:hypothetical protein
MMESIMDIKPTWASSCRQTTSSAGSRSSTMGKLPGGSRRSGCSFAAQADHHDLAAEVRVAADIAQRALRDLGSHGIDGHAAAIAVLQAHHVVDMGYRGSSSDLMRRTAKSSTPATHCTVVVMARMLRVPTVPSALR